MPDPHPLPTFLVILFLQVDGGHYTVYAALDAADADNLGRQIVIYPSFAEAKSVCDVSAACIGMSYGTKWRTFGGSLWQGSVAKVKVVGETINSWIQEPSAD